MKTHFYFDFLNKGVRLSKTMPARLTVHNIEDTSEPRDNLLIDCEISTNGKWGVLGNWQRARGHDTAEMLRLALQKLADQQYDAKRALLQMRYREDDIFQVDVGSYGAYVNFRSYDMLQLERGGIVRHWYISSFTVWDSDTLQSREIVTDRYGEYQNLLRGAIVTLLRSQVEFRRAIGLKPTAPFDAVLKRLEKLGEQFAWCQQEIWTAVV